MQRRRQCWRWLLRDLQVPHELVSLLLQLLMEEPPQSRSPSARVLVLPPPLLLRRRCPRRGLPPGELVVVL